MKRIPLFVILIALIVLIAVFYTTKKSSQQAVLPETDEVAGVSESKDQDLTELPQNTTKTTDQNSEEKPDSSSTRNILKNGDLELALRFEDPTITAEEAQRITDDINHIFSDVHLKIISEEHREYLEYEGLALRHPEPLHQFLPVQNDGNDKYFLITNSISNAYREAFDFLEQNKIDQDEVKSFLSLLESGNAKPESVIVPPGISVSEEKLSKGLKDMKGSNIKLPSVLSYVNMSPDFLGPVTAASTILIKYKENEISHVEDLVLIRIENKWKITF